MKLKLKLILFSLLPLLLLFLAAEVFFRWAYFSKKEKRPLAFIYNFELWKNKAQIYRAKMDRVRSERELDEANQKISALIGLDLGRDRQGREKCVQGLYTPEGKELLEYFRAIYETSFDDFSKEVKESGATLLITYFPSGRPQNEEGQCRAYFKSISEKRGIPFFDMTPLLEKYPKDYYLLLPENAHLSRFGNQLIAGELKKIIENDKGSKSIKTNPNRPALLGDLSPHVDQILEPQAGLVYRETVNSQGLRMDQDLAFPKQKQRILCIGDSFTYGPYLFSTSTYPGLLQRGIPEAEVVNGGCSGYHIQDELAYFRERGKFVEADVVILQVLDNDIPGQFFFYQNLFSRTKKKFLPTQLELEFFEKMKSSFK
jgi:lysophospholipase L1-like esterase